MEDDRPIRGAQQAPDEFNSGEEPTQDRNKVARLAEDDL